MRACAQTGFFFACQAFFYKTVHEGVILQKKKK